MDVKGKWTDKSKAYGLRRTAYGKGGRQLKTRGQRTARAETGNRRSGEAGQKLKVRDQKSEPQRSEVSENRRQ